MLRRTSARRLRRLRGYLGAPTTRPRPSPVVEAAGVNDLEVSAADPVQIVQVVVAQPGSGAPVTDQGEPLSARIIP